MVEDSKLPDENKSPELIFDIYNTDNTDDNKHSESVRQSFIRKGQSKQNVCFNKYQSNNVTRFTYEMRNVINDVTENDHGLNIVMSVVKVIKSFIAKHDLKVENCPELCLLIHLVDISKNIGCTNKNAGVPLSKPDQVHDGAIKLSHSGYILQYFF